MRSQHAPDDTAPPSVTDPARGERRGVRPGVVAAAACVLLALGGVGAGAVLLNRSDAPEPGAAPGPSAATPSASARSGAAAPDAPLVGGWYAGASGLGVADGTFEAWLGQPVGLAATWADTSAEMQRNLSVLSGEYAGWTRAMDLAVGGTVLGSDESYAAAARGDYDERWRAAAATLAAARGDVPAPTFVRMFHEMNGFWYKNWTVTADNAADYRAAHARYARILREAMPSVYISWSPNFRDHTGLPVAEYYPGDDVVDCVAPDYYDDDTNPGRLSVAAWNAEADDVDERGNPLGPEAWRRFAEQRGKPLCFPETGLKPSGNETTDHPAWIRGFNGWLNTNANTASWRLGEPIPAAAAGRVLYTAYFNVPHEGQPGFTIHGRNANPRSEKVYRSLTWGRPPG